MALTANPNVTNQWDFGGLGLNNRDIFWSGSGATLTLLPSQSGGIFAFDSAAGIVYTLPAPSTGLKYTFVVTVTATSNFHKVITDAATTFLNGIVYGVATDNSNTVVAYPGNGTSHIAIKTNGTTTGGIKGMRLDFLCTSSTLWTVLGNLTQTGSTATPFSTT